MTDQFTLTLLFTDIERSSSYWESHPAEMASAVAAHDLALEQAIVESGGKVFKRMGDGICAVFQSPTEAMTASLKCQSALSALAKSPIDLRIRIAIHTGQVFERDGDFHGEALSRVTRIMGFARGGQVLLSRSSAEGLDLKDHPGVSLRDLGSHTLRGLRSQETVFQAIHPALSCEPAIIPPPRNAGRLPQAPTSFVGRQSQLTHISALVVKRRLVTIVGSGGIGKTRLALEAARVTGQAFPGGTWFVSLENVTNVELVLPAIGTALGAREHADQTLTEALSSRLASERLLLIVDNCEHLTDAAARAIGAVLDLGPSVHVLATGREVLGLKGEQVFQVPPLSVPSDAENSSIRGFESVRLFIERAMSANPQFRVTEDNLDALCRLTRELDGIPLALELAAARMRTMSVRELLERLDGSFADLKSTYRDESPRHQTLLAAMDWSYRLLGAEEKRLFARLGVFAGSWSLASCEAVAAVDPLSRESICDLMSSLVDKSLAIAEETNGEMRFRLLETVRTLARSRLSDCSDEGSIRKGFFRYMCTTAKELATGIRGAEQQRWRRLFDREIANFRAAIEWGLSRTSAVESVAALACNLATTWLMNGQFSEACDIYDRILERLPDASVEVRARVLALSGSIRAQAGNRRGLERMRLAVSLAEKCDRRVLLECNGWLATALFDIGEYDESEELFLRELHLIQESPALPEAHTLLALGAIAVERGDYATAEKHYRNMIHKKELAGDVRGQGLGLCYLAHLKFLTGDSTSSELYQRSMQLLASVPDYYSMAANLKAASSALCTKASFEAAAQVQGFASQMVERVGVSIDRHIAQIGSEAGDAVRTVLGAESYEEWFEQGKLQGLDDVLHLLGCQPLSPDQAP